MGVVAIARRTQRAIKWVDEPRAFIVEFGRGGGGDPDDGGDAGRTGVEAPLFGGAAQETVDLAIEFDRGADFTVVTRDFDGIEYRASMTHAPGPRAIWNGVEHCTDWQGHSQRHTVALVWIDVDG